jgi:hypothetical protein
VDWAGIFIGAVIGNLIGGAITYLVSRFFYVRAAKGLERETAKLRQDARLIQRGLEEGLDIKYRRNEQTGEIESIIIEARASMGVSTSFSARSTVRRHEDDASADQE